MVIHVALVVSAIRTLTLLNLPPQHPYSPPESAPPVVLPAGSDYLSRSDPVWIYNASTRFGSYEFPSLWTEAPFVGNGMVGAYVTVTPAHVMIEVARHDYWDVRLPGTKYVTDQ